MYISKPMRKLFSNDHEYSNKEDANRSRTVAIMLMDSVAL